MARNSEDAVAVLQRLQDGPITEIRLALDSIHEDLVNTRIGIGKSGNGNSALKDCLSRTCQKLKEINAAARKAKQLSEKAEEN